MSPSPLAPSYLSSPPLLASFSPPRLRAAACLLLPLGVEKLLDKKVKDVSRSLLTACSEVAGPAGVGRRVAKLVADIKVGKKGGREGGREGRNKERKCLVCIRFSHPPTLLPSLPPSLPSSLRLQRRMPRPWAGLRRP